ncbi:proline dehydrogenase 1, mitochondrial-like isoform X2 [Daphnia pulicaria]|uniref:proline dehydrogenase 1, mitochondrial-like isoform X2 n=1 Tax=Daphnia pulicaria TaxID=35523 RepID=UPI001EEB5547|nr:proline dehydrogenase 1, mitochondrial-like isoform X2 [Daphnia pulicaria]
MYSAMNRSCVQWARVQFLHNTRLPGRPQVLPIGTRGLASPPPALSMGINKRQSDINNDSKTSAVPSVSSSGRRDPLDLSFDNAEAAFRSKTTLQVLRAYLVFTLCSSNYLVENNMKLMKIGKKLLGKRLFKSLMKATFYGQFVAGENQTDIMPTIQRMRSFGVKSILDYSAEEDISAEEAAEKEMASCVSTTVAPDPAVIKVDPAVNTPEADKRYHAHREFADRRQNVNSARTYFYLNEAQCEKNVDIFLRCIEAVSGTTKSTGFAAIKMTALGRPQLLLQLSEVIARSRRYFTEVTGLSADNNILQQHASPAIFEKRFEKADILTDNPAVKKWLQQMTYDQKGLIHLFSWSGLIDANILLNDFFKVPNLQTGRMEPLITALSPEEEEMACNMLRRLNTIFSAARDLDVRVMVDAEQSYFQPAISRLTMELMRKYNKEKAIVFNTYQCYLKETYNNIVLDLEQANRQNFYFGAKLVRGAYMEQERARASALGYQDPINPTYEATTAMYEKTLLECLTRIKDMKTRTNERRIGAMVASHNEDTVRFAIKKMEELGISPEDKVICFGQLLGMCDQISFPLGQSGYSVYKYVPYGPVDEVLPYLSRRAQENRGILTKIKKEKRLLVTELKRRLVKGQLFSTPKGDYVPI